MIFNKNQIMNLIYRFRIIIVFVVPLLILLSIRSCRSGSFKYDARRWAETSLDNSNVLHYPEIGNLAGEKLIICLDDSCTEMSNKSSTRIHISPDSVLTRKYLTLIKDHKGPVLISSADPALSARIWMVISQTGCNELFILSDSDDNEVFKYEFRPYTMGSPEF
jgi:hypothetical protein